MSTLNDLKRDKFNSKIGFILSCIGSAVGMANIWLFPYRINQFGGGAFLILYIFFTFAIGTSGLVGEIAFGRAMQSGAIGAFSKAYKNVNKEKLGKFVGCIPIIGCFGIAVGYAVIVGWVLRFLIGSLTGDVVSKSINTADYFSTVSGNFSSIPWHLAIIIITGCLMIFGISGGIEKLNKIMMPLFFILFLFLAFKVFTLENSFKGYEYIFNIDFKYFFDPKTWVYALGQSFFSISVVGGGMVVYGSYLNKDVDVVNSARNIVIFDTIAAILAAFVIIPSVFSFGFEQTSGPVLLFITIPEIFKNMLGGQFFSILFFAAVFFAGITSLINLVEVVVEAVQYSFNLSRSKVLVICCSILFIVGIFLEGDLLSPWMDIVSIYIIPLGAFLGGMAFFWLCSEKFVKEQIDLGRQKPTSLFFIKYSKYVFCIVSILVYLLGILFGGIG